MLDVDIAISAPDELVRRWVLDNFGAMRVRDTESWHPALSVGVEQAASAYHVFDCGRPQQWNIHPTSPAQLLYRLEKLLTVELQRRRADLLFIHAAAVARCGRAFLLAGDTGAGKSTTTWGLLRHGLSYLSDELGPIDVGSMQVLPYPHALCLKHRPAPPYALPVGTLDLGRTLHVPASLLGAPVVTEPVPLAGIFLLRHDPDGPAPRVRQLTAAEAVARLYVTGLNTLAHPEAGLPAMLRVATAVPCFGVVTADLGDTCRLIASTVDRLATCVEDGFRVIG